MPRCCRWPLSWWHARKRHLDRVILVPSLEDIAGRRYPGDNPDRVARAVERALTLHKELPAQRHWRCPCAMNEEKTSP